MNELVVRVGEPHRKHHSLGLYPLILWLLTFAFLFRVTAQLAVLLVEIPYLPEFSEWHSGALPYPLLLACQWLIFISMFRACFELQALQSVPRRKLGRIFLILGTVYLLLMGARHVLGLTLLSHIHWFTRYLPIYFHYVLALFLIIYGRARSQWESVHHFYC